MIIFGSAHKKNYVLINSLDLILETDVEENERVGDRFS